jgi:hypothetical protein
MDPEMMYWALDVNLNSEFLSSVTRYWDKGATFPYNEIFVSTFPTRFTFVFNWYVSLTGPMEKYVPGYAVVPVL